MEEAVAAGGAEKGGVFVSQGGSASTYLMTRHPQNHLDPSRSPISSQGGDS